MPLPAPAPRRPLHHRTIDCVGYERDDGLWDIEGHLVDTKTYDIANHDRNGIAAGEPLHGMGLRLTIDLDLRIHAVAAATDHAPFHQCPEVADHFQRLVGLTIGPGFRGKVRERLGGAEGCTHLVELLGPLSTVAFQTLLKARTTRRKDEGKADEDVFSLLNSCHALRMDGPVVAREWPDYAVPAKNRAGG
ncbi:hypothetical protein CKO38_15490 [Rhodospirillum rubrum]|uniref:DUF2889 domain-containing protein n=1 Tax=Rhodospirillum rubrum TaxID=1085 RepID=UPI001905013B|nr:DUF2889 domain-containing protein [Rhodospirillum rubrum]MBK1665749.1 hypothetical protein [Rhodospirillum rubrum]MBK1678048.1 hypothetical protein [Rhodospirillum rubrum]